MIEIPAKNTFFSDPGALKKSEEGCFFPLKSRYFRGKVATFFADLVEIRA